MAHALIIGGHGKIALLAAPLLQDRGFTVTSLIRNPDQVSDIEARGASALIRDVTDVSAEQWDSILANADVVIWSAGNGGRGGSEVTYAVDRDAALAVIDSLERLADQGKAPRYLNVSYLNARNHQVPESDSFYPYAEAKKTVDDRLSKSDSLDYLILGPSRLTDEPATGAATASPDLASEDSHTSRELVAQVIADFAARPELPTTRIVEFVDGDGSVSEL